MSYYLVYHLANNGSNKKLMDMSRCSNYSERTAEDKFLKEENDGKSLKLSNSIKSNKTTGLGSCADTSVQVSLINRV